MNNLDILRGEIAKEKELVIKIQKSRNAAPLVKELGKVNDNILKILNKINLIGALPSKAHGIDDLKRLVKDIEVPGKKQIVETRKPAFKEQIFQQPEQPRISSKSTTLKKFLKETTHFEKHTLKRLGKKEKKEVKTKLKKPNHYVKFSNSLFSGISINLAKKKMFRSLKRNLIQANLPMLPVSYISVIFFTTLISFFAGLFIFTFFLFFSVTAELPIVTQMNGSLFDRFFAIFWIIFVVPIVTFLFMYSYPSMERKSLERKIDQELPFATIHMSAISGSMVEPSKIFNIILSTKEYPNLSRQFTKLINEINIYGYDLVSALRDTAQNNPSKKLSELLNGMATTISSGGNLPDFFDKRAQTLLFEYRLEREKYTRAAETFMDIYISVVIAAPMIFMLLFMMIKVSGLGISLSSSMITLIMVLGVTGINIIFLTFLQLKQPSG